MAAIQAAGIIAVLVLAGACSREKQILSPSPGFVPRQGKLEQPLIDQMAKVPANTPISVVVTLTNQLSEPDKRLLLQTNSAEATNGIQKLNRQRRALTRELKRLADTSQTPLLAYLRDLETNGVVREVRSIWLSNVIGVQAPSNVIQNLASSNEVESIHLDLPRHIIHQATGGVPWGVLKVEANSLAPVANNQTVVVAVLDTGVDYTHPDLAKRIWVNTAEDLNKDGLMTGSDINNKDDDGNGYVDDVMGWNFSGTGTHDPADVHGHGTHVAGIIAGDGTGGVHTGIAPQARIMALRESNTSALSTEQDCWQAMQYAATNGAHIVNFSSGWMDYYQPAYAAWRLQVQNLTDAGVLFVTVSDDVGNAVDPPFSVSTPGRVPAALTVGSSKPNDSIPPYSCKGPVTWENVISLLDYPFLPGLIKPDLVAPGENITSTRNGGGYVNMSGTSMAAPHVAGVAALLLAQNPNLSPYDVRYILEETAKNVYGPAQPDAGSGWGRLNAKAALAFTIDPSPYDLVVSDIRVDKVPEPGKPALCFARAKNLGGQVVGNAELRFYFVDAPNRTVADLDPNSDGKPDDANFTYIGSYFVPVLGPTGSKHDSVEGVVRWANSVPRQNRWWIGVWALPGATSAPEAKPRNNGAVFQIPVPGGN